MLSRRIATEEDLEKFQSSKTYEDVVGFILALNDAAIDHDIGFAEPVSPAISALSAVLDKVTAAVRAHPAKPSKSRFGKPEFVDLYDDIKQHAQQWFERITTHEDIVGYFTEAFGNRSRLDYGSGHELNFICCLLGLSKLRIIQKQDYVNVVLGVFPQYLRIMRLIQQTYWLEPAGSHGVWGLDDYHFLPYLFGSGQLVNDKYIRPISIHDEDIVAMYENKNLYFWCISFISRIKTATLRWHSPMLDDISGVKRWSKVNEGMIKMYKAEVLGKVPIVQHFLFGELLPAPEGTTNADEIGEEVHVHCWADCCGIRIPSAIAASNRGDRESENHNADGGHVLRKSAAVPLD